MSIENKIKEIDKLNAELKTFNEWVDRECKICSIASEVKLVKRGYWGTTCEAKIHGAPKDFNDLIFNKISSDEFLEFNIEKYRKVIGEKLLNLNKKCLMNLGLSMDQVVQSLNMVLVLFAMYLFTFVDTKKQIMAFMVFSVANMLTIVLFVKSGYWILIVRTLIITALNLLGILKRFKHNKGKNHESVPSA